MVRYGSVEISDKRKLIVRQRLIQVVIRFKSWLKYLWVLFIYILNYLSCVKITEFSLNVNFNSTIMGSEQVKIVNSRNVYNGNRNEFKHCQTVYLLGRIVL